MTYTPDYTSEDVTGASIDAIAKGLIFISNLAVIVLGVIVVIWVKRSAKR